MKAGRYVFSFLLCLYLVTGGGHGYSVDGAFGYEMAKTALLDPEHEYFRRFKTAFARWGALMPLLGQPFVVVGDALARAAPERDALVVDGHRFRVEEWPPIGAGGQTMYVAPPPSAGPERLVALDIVSFLANAAALAQGTLVGQVRVWEGEQAVLLPVRAGVETAEWAYDRPDMAGKIRHQRPPVVGHWIGQPRGNLYLARLTLPSPMRVDRWELLSAGTRTATSAAGPDAETWQVRAAAFRSTSGVWHDARTGERYWSERQTRDFFTRLVYATLNAVATAASAALVYAIGRQMGYAPAAAAAGALAYGAATMAWVYAKLDFAEPASTALTLVAIWSLYRTFPVAGQGSGHTASGAARWGLVASGALALAVLGKYTSALAAAALLGQWALWSGWWSRERRRVALTFLAALLMPAAIAGAGAGALANRLTGEVPIVLTSGTSRLAEDWLALPLWTGLRGLLFSPGKSLFLYSPWLLLALPGTVLLARRHGRAVGVLFVAFPILTVVLYGMKLVWHGGSWGPRYLVPILPLLCVGAVPAIQWCLDRGRSARLGLTLLATASAAVQLVAIGKDPEQYPSMVREFVVPALPDEGSRLGGRDYWLARGGPGLARALQDPEGGGQRGLGYLWGYPTAELTVEAREPRSLALSLYFVDWDAQQRRQVVEIQDAVGRSRHELGRDFSGGLWLTWPVTIDRGRPLHVGLTQTGQDTAVLSAVAFDPLDKAAGPLPVADHQTRGDWWGRYGRDGYVLFGWRSFNIDLAHLPSYALRYDVSHVGDKPDPRIHVEIAQQDVLDTPLLYALPFSPLLGNAWLLAADAAHLILPARPDLTEGVLLRPPWTWFGIQAPRPPHPEYGLGLDFWPTLLYTNYASHRSLLVAMGLILLALQAGLVRSAARLLRGMRGGRVGYGRGGGTCLLALILALAAYDWLQVQP